MSTTAFETFCAISGLPISHGAPVLSVPLAQIRRAPGNSTPHWTPLSPPIRGLFEGVSQTAIALASTPGSALCSRALGLESVDELLGAARSGFLSEPKRPASGEFEPTWISTGVALVIPEAWSGLLDLPVRVGAAGFESSEASGSLRASLARAASEAVSWTRAAAALVESATGEPASHFPPAGSVAERDELLFRQFSLTAVYMSKDLPDCEVFDAIFGHRAKGGLTFSWRALEPKLERLAMLMLPRVGFADDEIETAAFELCSLAAVNHAWMVGLGRRWAPTEANPGWSPSRGLHWIWADKTREMARAALFAQPGPDPHAAMALARIESHELSSASAGPAPRARGPL